MFDADLKRIRCDHSSCGINSPPDDKIMSAGGLINMDWYCKGGKHFCPDHNPERIVKDALS